MPTEVEQQGAVATAQPADKPVERSEAERQAEHIDRAVKAYEAEGQQSQSAQQSQSPPVSQQQSLPAPQSGSETQTQQSASSSPSLSSSQAPEQTDPFGQVLQYMQEHAPPGLAQKYRTGADALAGLLQAQELVGRRDEAAQWAKWAQENPRALYEQLAPHYTPPQQQQQVAAQPAAQQQDEAPPQPDWHELQQVTRDPQTGRWAALPGAIEGVAEKLNRAETAYYQRQRQLLQNPLANPAVRQHIEQNYVGRDEFAQLLGSLQQDRSMQAAQSTVERLSGKLFNNGDHRQGRTHWGNTFAAKLHEAEQIGIGRTPEGFVNHDLQNQWAEQQADLLTSYQYMMWQRNGSPPAAQPAGQASVAANQPPVSAVRAPQNGAQFTPTDTIIKGPDGRANLGMMLENALRQSVASGQISADEINRWSNAA